MTAAKGNESQRKRKLKEVEAQRSESQGKRKPMEAKAKGNESQRKGEYKTPSFFYAKLFEQ